MPSQFDDLLALAASSRPQTDACFVPSMFAVATAVDPHWCAEDVWGFMFVSHQATYYKAPFVPDLMALQHELVHAVQFLSTNFGLVGLLCQQALATEIMHGQTSSFAWPLHSEHNSDFYGLQSAAWDLHDFYFTNLRPVSERFGPNVLNIIKEFEKSVYEGHYRIVGSIGLNYDIFGNSYFDEVLHLRKKRKLQFGYLLPLQYTAMRLVGDDIVCHPFNEGALMESAAIMGEIAFIQFYYRGWLPEDDGWIDQHVREAGAPYDIAFNVFKEITGVSSCFAIELLCGVIDLCLMYRHTLLFDAPASGNVEYMRTPVSIFFDACHAVAELGVPLEWRDKKYFWDRSLLKKSILTVYQNDICTKIGIPSIEEMTKKGIKLVDKLLDVYRPLEGMSTPFDYITLLRAQKTVMERRLEKDKSFCKAYIIPTLLFEDIFYVLEKVGTFYNPKTSMPWRRPGEKATPRALAGRALIDILRGEDFDCPFRQGNPFYCLDERLAVDKYCVLIEEGKQHPFCPYLLLRRRFENPPGVDDA